MISVELSPVAAVLTMMVITYITRISGVIIMARAGWNKRLEKFCTALSGSVIVAIVVPAIVSGDGSFRLAAGTAAVVMGMTNNALLAMGVGAVTASIIRIL